MVAPELEKVAARNAGRFLVAKVNTDVLSDLGERFAIRSIPDARRVLQWSRGDARRRRAAGE